MIDRNAFADKQLELTGEFGKYILAHPDVLDSIPDGAYVYFEVAGEKEFNRYGQNLAKRQVKEGIPVVLVRIKGLAPVQGSRLIDPVIQSPVAGIRGRAG